MRKIILIALAICSICPSAFSQFALIKGDNVMELSGVLTSYFNYRFYDESAVDKKKNSFALDYAIFRVDGIYKKDIHYELQVNLARVGAVPVDATDDAGALMDAYVEYSGLQKYVNIRVGYSKVPFGRFSLIPTAESVFLQRAEVARGDVYSRRDVGVTLNKEFWRQRINIIAGIYSGIGERILVNGGDNDASGKFEYIGRAEFSYPAKYRYREIDEVHVPVPVYSIGGGFRYAEKKEDTGPDYSIKTIDGKKTSYSADIGIKYKGIAFVGEVYRFHMAPDDPSRLLGYPTDYFASAGYIGELSYYAKKYKSAFAIRYDQYNVSDLVEGDNESTISFGYNYLFAGMNSVLKVHYFYRLEREMDNEKWADDQIRIGYQLQF